MDFILSMLLGYLGLFVPYIIIKSFETKDLHLVLVWFLIFIVIGAMLCAE